MGNDEIVEEVRRVRNKHAEKFNYDISAICEDIRKKQEELKKKIVSAEKKRIDEENGDVLKAA